MKPDKRSAWLQSGFLRQTPMSFYRWMERMILSVVWVSKSRCILSEWCIWTLFHSAVFCVYLLSPGTIHLYNGMVRFWRKRNINDAEFYGDAIPVYIEAQHSLNVLAKGAGSETTHDSSTVFGIKDPLSVTEAAFNLYKYREAQVKRLYEATWTGFVNWRTRTVFPIWMDVRFMMGSRHNFYWWRSSNRPRLPNTRSTYHRYTALWDGGTLTLRGRT